jgi:hypothetical protein
VSLTKGSRGFKRVQGGSRGSRFKVQRFKRFKVQGSKVQRFRFKGSRGFKGFKGSKVHCGARGAGSGSVFRRETTLGVAEVVASVVRTPLAMARATSA